MTAGRLAASKPGATTNTVLYRTPITKSASTVLNVCNQSGSGVSYRAAIRDYEQVLHLDGLNTSAYKFQKGNPISAYKLKLDPGFQDSNAIPGTTFTTTNGATATILDVFKPTNDVEYFTKVLTIGSTAIDGDNQAGTFTPGETLTGATSGFTSLFRGMDSTVGAWNQYTDIAANGTTTNISRTTGLADGMYLTIGADPSTLQDGEVATINSSGINTTTNVLQITRGQLGTTAAVIPAGSQVNAWSASATVSTIAEGATYVAGDTVLTVANSTGFTSGGIIIIDNELCQITEVNGNDLSLVRGRYGTTDVDHNDGVNVTLLTDNGVYLLNFWSEGETVTGSSSNATVPLNFNTSTGQTLVIKYLFSLTSVGATDHQVLSVGSQYDVNRTYKYNLEDATCTNYPLKFSVDDQEGTNGAGTEYTAGVSKVGTAGTSGAYSSIEITSSTQTSIFIYADGTPAGSTEGVGLSVNVNDNPSYTEIYVYDVGGEALAAADTFIISNNTQTIQSNGITVGPFGYVQDFDAALCHLKVTIGEGSEAFAADDSFYDSPTLNNGIRTLTTVRTGKGLTIDSVGGADASRSAGTYSNLSINATNGSGDLTSTKVTVVVDGSGAATVTLLNGGYGHTAGNTVTVNDSQLGGGGGANLTFNLATVSTGIHTDQTAVYSAEDYFFYGKALAANVTDKNSSVIVGPGQNLLVYSSAADISYVLNGFETTSEDYTVINMTKIQSGG